LVELKARKENRERKIRWKIAFFTVWFRRKNKRDKKWGGKFSPRTHIFLSPQFAMKKC